MYFAVKLKVPAYECMFETFNAIHTYFNGVLNEKTLSVISLSRCLTNRNSILQKIDRDSNYIVSEIL